MRAALVVVLVVAASGLARADIAPCGLGSAWSEEPSPSVPLPEVRSFTVEPDGGSFVLTYTGELAADALLEVSITRMGQDAAPIIVDMMPEREQAPGFRGCRLEHTGVVDGDHVHVRLVAIDPAGHVSAPFQLETDVRYHHTRCGMGAIGAVFAIGIAFVLGLVILLGVLFAVAGIRARRIARAEPEPISLLVVEALARSRQVRAGLGSALCAAGVIALLRTDLFQVFASIPLLLGLVELHAYMVAHALLQALGSQSHAEAKDCRVLVHAQGGGVRTLEVSRRALTSARRNAVPRSTAT